MEEEVQSRKDENCNKERKAQEELERAIDETIATALEREKHQILIEKDLLFKDNKRLDELNRKQREQLIVTMHTGKGFVLETYRPFMIFDCSRIF